MLFPILPLYCEHLNFSPALIGIIVSSHSIMSIPLAIPLGRIMDRFSPIIGIRLGFLLNSISSVLLLGFKNLFGVISSQLIAGLGFLLIVVGAQTAISSTQNYYKKAKGFGQLALFGSIGQGIGPFFGGLIVTYFNFSLLFLITLLLSLPGIFIKTPKKRNKDIVQKNKSRISIFKDISNFLKDPNLIITLLFTSIAVFITSLRSSFLPIFLKNNSYKPDTIGILISIFSITMSIIRIFIA
ncbi:MFS transporter, partial [Desulfothermus sp.]